MVTKIVSIFDLLSEADPFLHHQFYNYTVEDIALIHQRLISLYFVGEISGVVICRTQHVTQMGSFKI